RRWPTCADIKIDNAEVTIIRTIKPSATPTILRRIDWLNIENDFTTPRMDRGEAGEAERWRGIFNRKPTYAGDRSATITLRAAADQRAPGGPIDAWRAFSSSA